MPTSPSPKPDLNALPTAPSRGDTPSTFRALADAFLAALVPFRTQMDTLSSWVNTTAMQVFDNATEAAEKAQEASDSQAAAEAAAASAALTSDVSAWVSGASYTPDDTVYSLLNYATYRAKTTHSGETTDPRDDTTNWAPVVTLTQATDARFFGTTEFHAIKEQVETVSGTTPTLNLSLASHFELTTSGNTTIAISNAPVGFAWIVTIKITMGGAHTIAITGGDFGDGGPPVDLASGDEVRLTLVGEGTSFDIFESWRSTA